MASGRKDAPEESRELAAQALKACASRPMTPSVKHAATSSRRAEVRKALLKAMLAVKIERRKKVIH